MLKKTISDLIAAGNFTAINDIIPYADVVGFECIEDDSGLLTVLRHRDSNIGNPFIPAVHGGVVGSLLEHAAVLHLLRELGGRTIPKTINVSIDFLRPCLAQDTFARGEVIKQGQRVANVRVQAWQGDPDKPVAAAHAHFLLG